MKLLIIADDFTGALDTGVQLSKHSIKTTVMSNPHTPPLLEKDCQVLVINTSLRHVRPQEAYECIQNLLQKYLGDFTHIYLKTDSVLRGNISAAFAAAMQILKKPMCFVPAFPNLKRTTKDATAYVNGTLLENSVFKDDPRTPTLESSVPDILNHEYYVKCECISAKDYPLFTKASLNNDTVYLFDCETNGQLHTIGDLIADRGLYEFTAGCAGFASTFAKHLPFETSSFDICKSSQPVLFVSGSATAVTLNQLDYARRHGYHVMPLFETMFSDLDTAAKKITDKDLLENPGLTATAKEVVAQLQSGQSPIIATAVDKKEVFSQEVTRSAQMDEEFLHNYIARYTSCLVKSIIDEMDQSGSELRNIVVFGGDMAASILELLSCYQLNAAGEITDGVPLCEINYNGHSRILVTKSGGFGEPDIVPVIEHYLRG